MTSYKKTIATMVLASMLIATVAYAEEAQAEDHATRSLMHGPLHPKMFQAGKALGKFGRWETRAGRNAIGNGYPALGLAGMASGFGNRGAGKILRRAGKFGWGGPHFGRKLQEAEQAPEIEGRSLQQFFGGAPTPLPHPGLFQAGKKIGKFGRWETRAGRNAIGNGHPALGFAGLASGFGNRGAGKILRRAGKGKFPFGRKLQHHHNPANPLEYGVGKGLKKVGKIEKKVGKHAMKHGHPILGAAAYAEGVGHKGIGKILKHDGKHGK